MPWAAVPFGEHALRKQLSTTFGISSIPTLILIGPDGTVLDRDARHSVSRDPEARSFPWRGTSGIRPECVSNLPQHPAFLRCSAKAGSELLGRLWLQDGSAELKQNHHRPFGSILALETSVLASLQPTNSSGWSPVP